MAFDDTRTEPLAAIGCLSIVCGLLAPAVNWLTGGWWGLLLVALPLVALVLFRSWRADDHR